jgi:DUF1009 family protein
MCGAGVLPARMAEEARRRGWRVVAFAFDSAPGVAERADRVLPARLTELGPVLAVLHDENVSAVLLSGRFSMSDVLRMDPATSDPESRAIGERAGSRIDARLVEAIIATLDNHGIDVLDQRDFVGDWLGGVGCWSARRPTDAEWDDVRRGLAAARLVARDHIGQTVVVRHGAVVAVEAAEGTTEAIRRGARLAGPGTVVVKAVAPDHDYRFDAPAVGPETLAVAAEGGVAVVALEARRVVLFDRAETLRIADAAKISVVGVDGEP